MDAILPQLLAFPPHPPSTVPLSEAEYDKKINTLLKTLNTISASKLIGGVSSGGDLLDILDPSINTLPYLYVLLAHIGSPAGKLKAVNSISDFFAPGKALWQKLLNFMENFDPIQIRYGGNEIVRLIGLSSTNAYNAQQPLAAIAPIRSAILRIDPSGSTFTSSHLVLVRLCLEARAYPAALPVLDKDIYHFPPSSGKATEATSNSLFPYLCSDHEYGSTYITPDSNLTQKLDYRMHLQYFLYGAMIYMALKDWPRAISFLELVMTSPTTHNASKIQAEAYKKWVLVGLLHKGRMLPTPKISQQTSKIYNGLCKAYTSLAEVFKNSIDREESAVSLAAEASFGHQLWFEDFNSGLVRQVIAAHRRFSVQHLENTYAALTIADVTRRTSHGAYDDASTGHYVNGLIASGQLNATLTQPSEDPTRWILQFANSPTEGPMARSEEQQYNALLKQTQRVKTLMEHVREADRRLGLSKEFIQEAKKARLARLDGEGGSHPSGSQDNPFDQDEDMMAEV